MESADQQRFEEAEAWFELGDLDEALGALDQISPGVREQPAVLEMRFHVCVKRNQWEAALEIARDLSRIAPGSLNAATLLACALHRLGRSEEAYDVVKPACAAFPEESGPPYILSRICCALGRTGEAPGVAWRRAGTRREGTEIAGVGGRRIGCGLVSGSIILLEPFILRSETRMAYASRH